MTPEIRQHVAQRRKRSLERCLKYRAMIAKGGVTTADDVFVDPAEIRKALRLDQKILLDLRILRSTGKYPTRH